MPDPHTAAFLHPASRSSPSSSAGSGARLPHNVFRYIFDISARHQVLLSLLTIAVFLLELAPIELQRRIVNGLVNKRDYGPLVVLCAGYTAVALVHGAIKLGLNVYRGWVGERATRLLRRRVNNVIMPGMPGAPRAPDTEGVAVSVIVAEVEPIGGFVGSSVSEPLLQSGVMLTVLVYMFTLQPFVALAMVAIFSPQFVFVPLMQRAINRRAASRVLVMRELSTDIVSPTHLESGLAAESETRIDSIFELNMSIFRLKFSMNFLMNLTNHFEVVGAFLIGGWYVLNGAVEVGTIVAFISSVRRLNDPWGDLVNYFRDVTSIQMKYRLLADAADALAQRDVPNDPS